MLDAGHLRRAFTEFFAERGHRPLPSAKLVPSDPTLLFTVAGMVPFKPWFLGDEAPAAPRVTTIQKCMRAGGKHNDLDAIGTTARHLTFFEMLGNFSFGDYFKERAIPYAWTFSTEVLGFDPEQLWVTVHHTDDEAAAIWLDAVGIRPERLQRMGEDNWWQMAETGPCGPSSELYFDKGPRFGRDGGPAEGDEERFVEFWNLVFMQHNRHGDGTLSDLPKRNIDTGAGFERVLSLVQGYDSVFDTDVIRPILGAAESVTARTYGKSDADDVALRILADHARSMTFLVSDGVFPTNDGRGYVLRRIIRRAVQRAQRLGVDRPITPQLVRAVVDVMADGYPELRAHAEFVTEVVAREEERFRATLRSGSAILEEELERSAGVLPGPVAFRLHDTYGFPIDLTRELVEERGRVVDLEGFESAMAGQRAASRAAGLGEDASGWRAEEYRELLEQFGTTRFVGYDEESAAARVLAVLPGNDAPPPGAAGAGEVELFLDETPFYAEGGGQVGDTGWLLGDGVEVEVLDTTAPLPGLHRHRAVVRRGDLRPGAHVSAAVDSERRTAIRRNHTGTHLLHWALREVLGPHVRQQGSLVAPDRLRFDFSHHAPLAAAQIAAVEDLVNGAVLRDEAVHTAETTRGEAEATGAIAFFGERYGARVRVVSAGHDSVELCGGTHVAALGMVGPLRIVSEGSIGANTRRIEALTGAHTLDRARGEAKLLGEAASLLQSAPDEVPDRIVDLRNEQRQTRDELRAATARLLAEEARALVATAQEGVVVARRDGVARDRLRDLALALRDRPELRGGVVIGSPDGKGVALVAAVKSGSGLLASELLAGASRIVGGGGGRDPEVAVAGGRHVEHIDAALQAVRATLAGN